MSAHTPGPLRAVKQSIWAGNRHLGSSDSPYVSLEAANANAVLWAAAPDLLLACQNVLRDLREQRDTKLCSRSRDQQIAELRTAILKATGGQS